MSFKGNQGKNLLTSSSLSIRKRFSIEETDFPYIRKWLQDERIHALWCANLLPYPLQEEAFRGFLRKNAAEWEDCPYIVTDDAGKPIGFFTYNINCQENYGFLKFIVLDNELRGHGIGSGMIRLICRFAFEITNVSSVRINVFDTNKAAVGCYRKAGFSEESMETDALTFQGEVWNRIHMVRRNEAVQDDHILCGA